MTHSAIKKRSILQISLVVFIILIIPAIFFIFMWILRPHTTQVERTHRLPFNGDSFLNAVNEKRKVYGRAPLKKNSWVCAVAQIRLQDELRAGNGTYDNQRGYKKAIQEVTQEYQTASKSGTSDPLPEFKYQYTFYAPTIEEGMQYFLQNTRYITIFTARDLRYGCGAAKDKYGLIVTAK